RHADSAARGDQRVTRQPTYFAKAAFEPPFSFRVAPHDAATPPALTVVGELPSLHLSPLGSRRAKPATTQRMARVFITGLGFVTSIGNDAASVSRNLRELRHGFELYPP